MTAQEEPVSLAAAERMSDVGEIFRVFLRAGAFFCRGMTAADQDAAVKVISHDRAPPEASQIHLHGDFRRSGVVTAQCVDIEPAVVVKIDELSGPRPASLLDL